MLCKLKHLLIVSLGLVLLCKCKNNEEYTQVILYTKSPYKNKFYITDIPFHGEKRVIIDSGVINRDNHDSLVIRIPRKLEKLYRIEVNDQKLRIVFINDAPVIRIRANYFSNKYTVEGSKATIGLKTFEDNQVRLAIGTQKINKEIDSLTRNHVKGRRLDSLNIVLTQKLKVFFDQYRQYADTVTSPAAFMKVYSTIDFGNDHEAEKKFILRNSARFASYMPLQHFKDEVLATIKIYEEEFNVGDKLPTITLPDRNGHPFSTASLNNQYYLIDFWSTLCQQCMIFKTKELEIANMIPSSQLEIVSVAIDDQTDEWKKNITLNGFKWPQLIDVKMWEGPAVRTLLFDSIPYNFLVAPGGKVIAKAIKPDSLVKTIAQLKLKK